MRQLVRVLAVLVIVPATCYFIYWVPFAHAPFAQPRWVPALVSLLGAGGVGWYVWRRLGAGPEGPVSSTLLGAVVLGSAGFCAGFFGPIVLAPEANQGPLLGIFITGPLGFVVGGIAGFAYWLAKGRKAARH